MHITSFKRRFIPLGLLSLVAVALAAQAAAPAAEPASVLTVIHLNDTHQMWEPTRTRANLVLEGESAERVAMLEIGGFGRVVAAIKELKASAVNPLVLHAGDFFQRKTGASPYAWADDAALWRLAGIQASALGNNEFASGTDSFKAWLERIDWPVLAANFSPAGQAALGARALAPSVVRTIGGQRVGIVGLSTGSLGEVVPVLQEAIDRLEADGVRRIILVSHLGLEIESQLPAQVHGLDLIVGGHSHSILGSWRVVGLGKQPDYPQVLKGSDGAACLLVSAYEYGKIVGRISLGFDAQGRLLDWRPAPVAVVGRQWYQLLSVPGPEGKAERVEFERAGDGLKVSLVRGGQPEALAPEQAKAWLPWLALLERSLEARPEIRLVDPDPAAQDIIRQALGR